MQQLHKMLDFEIQLSNKYQSNRMKLPLEAYYMMTKESKPYIQMNEYLHVQDNPKKEE